MSAYIEGKRTGSFNFMHHWDMIGSHSTTLTETTKKWSRSQLLRWLSSPAVASTSWIKRGPHWKWMGFIITNGQSGHVAELFMLAEPIKYIYKRKNHNAYSYYYHQLGLEFVELLCKSTQIALKVEQLLYLTDVTIVSPTALLLVILLHFNIIIHGGQFCWIFVWIFWRYQKGS